MAAAMTAPTVTDVKIESAEALLGDPFTLSAEFILSEGLQAATWQVWHCDIIDSRKCAGNKFECLQ